ncbi:RagB/SusD family nutrient uptake outer membrane protein [Flavihumibacter petaseus]|uniref:Aromatic L-amino acid decarboxylase n=1 Tax=Flavihumibacter petaseus NBRC 106054 TaxID=1220578 RepID=A0A0E9MXQ3_9BACT|nr:RagB/SusD family nutrient uptake outer membrane protein [Flavihumibacter petaseus]GAO42293.1 aromatic L-amino acid decarboxylase [Flavihumibacter petaseus NBRC 106054]
MSFVNNKSIVIGLATSCAVLLSACQKDNFLDVDNLSSVSSATAFATPNAADLVLNDVYYQLPDQFNSVFDPFDNWSDNSMTGFSWTITANAARTKSNINSNSEFSYNWGGGTQKATSWLNWSYLYAAIRKCNVFIEGLEGSSLEEAYKNTRMGEAKVLRAYFYHLIWMMYGGGPIITAPDNRSQDGDAIYHQRASFDDNYTFLENELTEAASLLADNAGNNGGGRITKGAALTLKGWVELFYASPLYNKTNDAGRWAKAAATNKEVMELGYTLHQKYDELFMSTGNGNNEGVFYRQYLGLKEGSTIAGYQGPMYVGNQWLSWGGSTPTQELVDDYPMANGLAISDPGSGYDPQNPYANRDSRFRQSVLFNGNTFNGQPYISAVGSGFNEIDLADATDQTNTGYAMKKGIDTTVNVFQWGASSQTYYYFRYAEVLLNYAEAQNESAGPDASVYEALDQLRSRAGTPTFSQVYPGASQATMRELIRKERRIELAFEGKRYFDLLRWKTAEDNLNHVMHGMKVTPKAGGGYTYERVNAIPPGSPQWSFDPEKNYLLPIPLSIMGQNPELTQNPNY